MPAPGHLRPADDVVGPLHPLPRPHQDLPGEDRHRGRDLDPLARRERAAAPGVEVLVVDARRRGDASRRPIEHQVRQEVVPGDRVLEDPAAVGPGGELLEEPPEEARRRVVQPVPERGGAGALDGEVGHVLREHRARLAEPSLLLVVEGAGGGAGLRPVSLHVEVKADDGPGMPEGHGRGDERAPVPALRPVALVAEHVAHQRVHDLADRPRVHPGLARRLGERIAGKGRGHDVERIAGFAAVPLGMGQHPDDPVELEERARPAVLEEERKGVGVGRALVHEVDPEAPGRRGELAEAVEAGFRRPPVVAVRPIGGVALNGPELRPLPPPVPLDLVRPAGARETFAQIRQGLVRYVDPERLGCCRHSCSSRLPAANRLRTAILTGSGGAGESGSDRERPGSIRWAGRGREGGGGDPSPFLSGRPPEPPVAPREPCRGKAGHARRPIGVMRTTVGAPPSRRARIRPGDPDRRGSTERGPPASPRSTKTVDYR